MTGTSSPWPHVFDPGTITLMNGSPNAGKTALMASMLQRIAVGGDLFGHKVGPAPVFYIAMDRLWRTGAKRWFEKIGFDIPYYSFVDDRLTSATTFRDVKTLPWDAYVNLLVLRNLAPGTLITADPFENAYGNVMDRAKVITASTVLQRFLDDHGHSQNGMMHSSKMKADGKENYANVHEQMAGSGALSGYSSAQITLLAPAQSKRGVYELHITSHSLPAMLYSIPRDNTGCFQLDDAEALEGTTTPATALSDADLLILGLIPEVPGSISRAELVTAAASQISEATVDRALTALLTAALTHKPANRRGQYQQTAKAKTLA